MLRNVAEPGDAGGLEGDVGVEAAGDGAVDDGLLLLVQQPNQLPLGADEAVDLPVRVVQKPHDGRLFVGRRENRFDPTEVIRVKAESAFNDTGRNSLDKCISFGRRLRKTIRQTIQLKQRVHDLLSVQNKIPF